MKRIFHLRGRTVVVNGEPTNEFHPYFYVIGEKPRRDESIVGLEEVDLNPYIYRDGKYVEGSGKVYKVLVEKPSLVTKLRERYKLVSQSYIKYSARASIDLNTQTWRDLLPAKDPAALVGFISWSVSTLSLDLIVFIWSAFSDSSLVSATCDATLTKSSPDSCNPRLEANLDLAKTYRSSTGV